MARILIVGGGYTGSRAAAWLRRAGHDVVVAGRSGAPDLHLELPDGSPFRSLRGEDWRVLWTAAIVDGCDAIAGKASRIVYLSTTGVYGDARVVDATTPPSPTTARTRARLAAEQCIQAGPWTACILRPAAIYGPGRGAQESIRAGRWKISGDGSTYTSRIHVDDLARIAACAVLADFQGAWPVADDEPCTNLEITQFCCEWLGVPLPPRAAPGELDESRRADRRVDGRAIRSLTSVTLEYPSYRLGVPAALRSPSNEP